MPRSKEEIVPPSCPTEMELIFIELKKRFSAEKIIRYLLFRHSCTREDAEEAIYKILYSLSIDGRYTFSDGELWKTSKGIKTIIEDKYIYDAITRALFDTFRKRENKTLYIETVNSIYQVEAEDLFIIHTGGYNFFTILIKVLEKIDPIFSNPYYLHYFCGNSYLEISELLEVNEGTIKSRISRGKEDIEEHLRLLYIRDILSISEVNEIIRKTCVELSETNKRNFPPAVARLFFLESKTVEEIALETCLEISKVTNIIYRLNKPLKDQFLSLSAHLSIDDVVNYFIH